MRKKKLLWVSICMLIVYVYFFTVAFLFAEQDISFICAEDLKRYASLFNGANQIETFMYFTDPHLAQKKWGWEEEFQRYIEDIKYVYNHTATDFLVCGGDWIGDSDTQVEACYKLGYIGGVMRSQFDNYYPVLGNHDTNYLGKSNDVSSNLGTLTNETIENLWYRGQQSAYYCFQGIFSNYYVLNTQEDRNNEMNDYKWAQVDWLASSLLDNDSLHTALFLHIGVDYLTLELPIMSQMVGEVIAAYNARAKLIKNGKEYDFSACSGRVDYVMSGHIHADLVSTIGGVPLIATTNLKSGGRVSFDLCLADYDKGKLYLVRVGMGEDRVIDI